MNAVPPPTPTIDSLNDPFAALDAMHAAGTAFPQSLQSEMHGRMLAALGDTAARVGIWQRTVALDPSNTTAAYVYKQLARFAALERRALDEDGSAAVLSAKERQELTHIETRLRGLGVLADDLDTANPEAVEEYRAMVYSNIAPDGLDYRRLCSIETLVKLSDFFRPRQDEARDSLTGVRTLVTETLESLRTGRPVEKELKLLLRIGAIEIDADGVIVLAKRFFENKTVYRATALA